MKQIRQEFSQVSNQYSPRLEKLLMRLENQRVHMTELVALHRKEKPELAARLQSLIRLVLG